MNLYQCVIDCPDGYYKRQSTKECLTPEQYPGYQCINEETREYRESDYDGRFFTENDAKFCINQCNETFPYYQNTKECAQTCINEYYFKEDYTEYFKYLDYLKIFLRI